MSSEKAIFTIPNLLSFLRIPLAILFAWFYQMQTATGNILAVVMVLLSALSDCLDGKIARKFNCVTNLGKFLDPLADKITQLILIICLLSRGKIAITLLIIFLIKEIMQLIGGAIIIRGKGKHYGSFIWGKVNTVILYAVMAVLLFIPAIPASLQDALFAVCILSVIATFFLYLRQFIKIMKPESK